MSDSGASAAVLWLLGKFIDAPGDTHSRWACALGLTAPASLETWRARHTQSFIEQCYPFASVYLGPEGAIGGVAANRVADFRRLLGSTVNGPPDALGDLLADYAALVEHSEHDPRAQHARKTMLWEHLLCWLFPFLDSVVRVAPAPYAQWASLTREVFIEEADFIGDPGSLPLHLRAAPAGDIGAHSHSLDDVVRSLLIPVRSGLVITRQDLSRIADEADVADHIGSRHLLLQSLLKQHPKATLRQLARNALHQAQAYGSTRNTLGVISDFWSERAFATAAALKTMETHASTAGVVR